MCDPENYDGWIDWMSAEGWTRLCCCDQPKNPLERAWLFVSGKIFFAGVIGCSKRHDKCHRFFKVGRLDEPSNLDIIGAEVRKENKMKIEHIETRYVQESAFCALINPAYIDGSDFAPYYRTVIVYRDDDGLRCDVHGDGASEYESEQEALRALDHQLAIKARHAYEIYLAEHGAGMIHIA